MPHTTWYLAYCSSPKLKNSEFKSNARSSMCFPGSHFSVSTGGWSCAAKVMAATAVDVLRDETLLAAAKADHAARTAATPYVCPMPPDVKPNIQP